MSSLTLGTILTNGDGLLGYAALVIIAICGISGVWLVYSAVRDITDRNPNRQLGKMGIFAKIIAAAVLFSVPQAMGVVWTQFFGSSTPEQNLGAQASGTAAATDCLSSATGSSGTTDNAVACMINNVATGVVPQFVTFILILAGVSGVWFWYRFIMALVNKISLTEGSQRLPWGYLVVGTLFCGVGALTAAVGNAFGFASSAISASGYAASTSYLSYIPDEGSLSPQVIEMITGGYAICAALGIYEVVHAGYILASAMNPYSTNATGWKAVGHAGFGIALVCLPSLALAIAHSVFGTTSF
jgi:hypothetical protein